MSVQSHVAQTDFAVCVLITGVFQCCLGVVTIPGWDSIPWSHHTTGGMHLSQEEVSGSAASALLSSLPALLVLHSFEAEVPVCWECSPLPVTSEGLALLSALLLPKSV